MVHVQLATSISNEGKHSDGLCAGRYQNIKRKQALRRFVCSLVPVQQMKEHSDGLCASYKYIK